MCHSDVPVCPLHKNSMIRVEVKSDPHYKCRQHECPIHWNPTTGLYYLKSQNEARLREYPELTRRWRLRWGAVIYFRRLSLVYVPSGVACRLEAR